MVRCCCVKGCRNRSNRVVGLSYFSIPAVISTQAHNELSIHRRQQWIEAVGRDTACPKWEPRDHHKVCSHHFVSGRPAHFDDCQNVDWVPTLKLAPVDKATLAIREAATRWKDWAMLIGHIVEYLKTGNIDGSVSTPKQEEIAKAAQIYYIESGVVYRRRNRQTRTVVTLVEERDDVLNKAHLGKSFDGGSETNADDGATDPEVHCDFDTCVASIKARYCWKGIKQDVLNWIQSCRKCTPSAEPEQDEFKDLCNIALSDNESTDKVGDSAKPKKKLKSLIVNIPKSNIATVDNKAKIPFIKIMPSQSKATGDVLVSKITIKTGATVAVQGSSKLLIKGSPSGAKAGKLALKSAAITDQQAVSSSGPKAYRPAAWLLHGIGVRMVRERVYSDLIEIQEQKDVEGQLASAEQTQLTKLQGARNELAQKNAYLTNNSSLKECRCGFTALLSCEMELHRDYGHPSHSIESGKFDCCQCGAKFVRSAIWIATHIERIHGRHARSYTPPPPTGICPFCPFEQRTTTKCKLSRHIERCSAAFVIDRNLALLPADCDIPVIDTRPPSSTPSLTIVAKTATTSSMSSGGSPLTSIVGVPGTPKLSVASLNTLCSTVSTVDSISTPSETSQTPLKPVAVKLKGRPSLITDGPSSQFEICELCGAFVRSRQSLVSHLATAHRCVINSRCVQYENPPVMCGQCTERFWTPIGLEQHLAKMHAVVETAVTTLPPVTVCPLCKRTRLTDVVEHLARQHRITLVDMFLQRYCSVCQLDLHAARPFETHMVTRHSELFADRAALRAAVLTVDHCTRGKSNTLWRGRQPAVLAGAVRKPLVDAASNSEMLVCSTCKTEYTNEVDMKRHVEAAHSFSCTFCSRRFSTAGFLRIHLSSAHDDEVVSCEVCGVDVEFSEMASHMSSEHTKRCSVTINKTGANDGSIHFASFRRPKRSHSVSSSISNSSSSLGEGSEFENETADHNIKRCKIAM